MPNVVGTGRGSPQVPSMGVPWDALHWLTFPVLTTNWQGHLGEGNQQIYFGINFIRSYP